MTKANRITLVKSENGFNYYLFKPSFRKLYFHNPEADTSYQKGFFHKIHMWFYLFLGGYNIIYLAKNEELVAYIVFTKAGKRIVNPSTKRDLFTIFLYTFPQFRNQGFASMLAICLFELSSDSCSCVYKTIAKTNISSIKVAEKVGFTRMSNARKTRFLRTVIPDEKGEWYLYKYQK